jgi:hypothetical protein
VLVIFSAHQSAILSTTHSLLSKLNLLHKFLVHSTILFTHSDTHCLIEFISVFLAISQAGANTLNGLNIHHSAAALPHSNKSFHSGFSFTVISAAFVTIFCNHSSNHSSNELHT